MKDPLSDLSGRQTTKPGPSEADKIRSRRNWVMLVALLGFVVLVFVVTLVKLKANVGPHF